MGFLDFLKKEQAAAAAYTPPSFDEIVQQARSVGDVTVLLTEVLPPGEAGARRVFTHGGLAELGVKLVSHPTLGFQPPEGQELLAMHVGTAPFPAEGLDLRYSGALPHGVSFLSLVGVAAGKLLGLHRKLGTSYPDPWAAMGRIRWMTRIATHLLKQGLASGVVVHRAGHVVHTPRTWHSYLRAEELGRADYRPFAAWVETSPAEGVLATHGMNALALPDVEVELGEALGPDEKTRLSRGEEALLVACHRMCREDRMLEPGEVLAVPVGVHAGPEPLEVDNPGFTEEGAPRYQVARTEGRLRLVPQGPVPAPDSLWEQAAASGSTEHMPYTAYRELLLSRFEAHGWMQESSLSFANLPGAPPYEVIVYRCLDGMHAVLTCGLGRKPQAYGDAEHGTAHLELLLRLPEYQAALGQTLGQLGRHLHVREEGEELPWGPNTRLAFAQEPLQPLGIKFLALAAAGRVSLHGGPAVTLLTPVLLTPEERKSLSEAQLIHWLQAHAGKPEQQQRWLQALHAATPATPAAPQ